MSTKSFTERQGAWPSSMPTRVHDSRPPRQTCSTIPAQSAFRVTLERLGDIRRQLGGARSIEVLLAPQDLPVLRHPNQSNPS
jgi:hypothetical protein